MKTRFVSLFAAVLFLGSRAQAEAPVRLLKVHDVARTDGTVLQRYDDLREFPAVGLITSTFQGSVPVPRTGQGAQGTAFLVSPCLAMTAHHVVFNYSSPHEVRQVPDDVGRQVEVRLTFGDRHFIGRPTVWGDRNQYGENDWAVVKIDACPGRDIGWLRIRSVASSTLLRRPMQLTAVGFPGNRDRRRPTIAEHCSADSDDRRYGYLKTTCPGVPGSSGSPVFASDEYGNLQVVAVTSAQSPSDRETQDRVSRGEFVKFDIKKHYNTIQPMSQILANAGALRALFAEGWPNLESPLPAVKARSPGGVAPDRPTSAVPRVPVSSCGHNAC